MKENCVNNWQFLQKILKNVEIETFFKMAPKLLIFINFITFERNTILSQTKANYKTENYNKSKIIFNIKYLSMKFNLWEKLDWIITKINNT